MSNQKVFRGAAVVANLSELRHPERVDTSRLVSQKEKEQLIKNYWDGPEMKYFVASFPLLDTYFDRTTEVAVRVVNIHDQETVEATWIPFYGDNTISQADLDNPNVQFYILSKDDYSLEGDGRTKLRLMPNSNSLTARLAKKGSKFFIMINVSLIKFKKNSTGFGNNGSGGSVQIPVT